MLWLALVSVVLADSLLWGPYRPQLYFGMRPQIPESLMTGLLWFRSNEIAGVSTLRHTIKNEDSVAKFGWEAYDPRLGGRQRIIDPPNGLNLTTDLVKNDEGTAWEVRIRGEQSPSNIVNMVYYAGLESVNSPVGASPEEVANNDEFKLSVPILRKLRPEGLDSDVVLVGKSKDLGKFKLTVTQGEGEHPQHHHEFAHLKPSENVHYTSLFVPGGEQWKADQAYITLMQDEVAEFLERYGEEDLDIPVWSILSASNEARPNANLHYIQQTFSGPFEFRIRFVPKECEHEFEEGGEMSDFDARLNTVLDAQKNRFDGSLALQKPYADDSKFEEFANEMVSSVAAGVGYFYGDSWLRARDGDDGEEVVTGVLRVPPKELFSGTPSRAFFPRGFYWDEGFNALALLKYDQDLVLRILNSWFDTMDEDGYIQREQILGEEARSLVPPDFTVQDRTFANPPTIVMALAHLTSTSNSPEEKEQADNLLRELYPKLQTHFKWFRRTQKGETMTYDREYPSQEVYRWRGRTKTHCLASGLDDYPRALEVADGDLNVDLVAWIGAMATSLEHIALRLGKEKDAKYYAGVIEGVKANLEAVFWDDESKAYCDVAIDEYEEDSHVCHIGYVTHIPFMLKLVPEESTERLLATLKHLRSEEELWSVGGVRSLSKQDPFYGTSENYWRGPVWNNMNYLTLDALLHYATSDKVDRKVRNYASDIYRELRLNVVENIYREYKKTGFVWESYYPITGEAKGAKAFTGWAALVANIMAMPEVPEVPEVPVVENVDAHDEL